jgi:hypothetical protein
MARFKIGLNRCKSVKIHARGNSYQPISNFIGMKIYWRKSSKNKIFRNFTISIAFCRTNSSAIGKNGVNGKLIWLEAACIERNAKSYSFYRLTVYYPAQHKTC